MTLASGAAAGKFLRYEAVAPSVAAQTAYGIECEVQTTLTLPPDVQNLLPTLATDGPHLQLPCEANATCADLHVQGHNERNVSNAR